jgi:HAD superfamily hydrolase (TIGR01509 family)
MTCAVLLDLYGTLVEPDWSILSAGRNAIADRVGVPRAAAHSAWEATHNARMRGQHGSLEGDLAVVMATAAGGGASDRVTHDLLAELAASERANWRRGVRLYPEVVPMLGRLRRAGARLAIVTNASAEAAGVIPELGLDGLVDAVFASCDARTVKPDLLLLAMRNLDVTRAEAVLVDDEPSQVAAATGMGISAILMLRDAAGITEAGDATIAIVRDLAELADHVFGGLTTPRG